MGPARGLIRAAPFANTSFMPLIKAGLLPGHDDLLVLARKPSGLRVFSWPVCMKARPFTVMALRLGIQKGVVLWTPAFAGVTGMVWGYTPSCPRRRASRSVNDG